MIVCDEVSEEIVSRSCTPIICTLCLLEPNTTKICGIKECIGYFGSAA